LNTPLVGPTGGGVVHVPFNIGVPPKLSTRANAAALLHAMIDRLVPAFGGVLSETVTVAVAFGQGAVP